MRTFKFLLYVVFAGFLSVSCERSPGEINTQPINYDYVGQIHNQGLNEVFGKLQKTRAQGDFADLTEIPPEERIECIKNSTLEYVRDQNVPEEVIDFTEVQLDKLLIIEENRDKEFLEPESIFPDDFNKDQSSVLTSKLEILDNIISDNDMDMNSLLSRIEALENSSLPVLSEEDLNVLLCATATARYSLQYWNENIDEWAVLCGVSDTRAEKFNWKQVVKEDVKGAAAGAVSLGFAKYLGPIGWKAWLIGIGSAALANSAADAVGQLIDMYL